MRSSGSLVVLFLLLSQAVGQTQPDFVFSQAASRLKALLTRFEEYHRGWFTEEFYKDVPAERLLAGLEEKRKQLGAIERTRVCKMTSPASCELEVISTSGKRVKVAVRMEEQFPYRFQYLLFGTIDEADDAWEKLNTDLQKLPGDTAVSIWRLGPARLKLFNRNATDPLAVGSSFKLLLLNMVAEEVAAGKRQWKDLLTLQAEGRSLPSGMLQDWPLGSPISLHTLVTMMIARSDNTAADHLMLALGRGNIELFQNKLQVQYPERNRPFLRTSELFKLKLILPQHEINGYAHRNEQDRVKFLPRFAEVKLANPRLPQNPSYIDQVEWFYTTDDMIRMLEALQRSPEAGMVLPLLAITRPFDLDDHAWSYLGFKGGAEVGVLNLTLLGQLRSSKEWFGLSFTWNRTDRALDEPLWLRMIQRALLLIERGK